jgi:hypothetical protein
VIDGVAWGPEQEEAKAALRAACAMRSLDEVESALTLAAKASLAAGAYAWWEGERVLSVVALSRVIVGLPCRRPRASPCATALAIP